MDLETIQPLDWLLKKDKFYLLAHFWQQNSKSPNYRDKFMDSSVLNRNCNNNSEDFNYNISISASSHFPKLGVNMDARRKSDEYLDSEKRILTLKTNNPASEEKDTFLDTSKGREAINDDKIDCTKTSYNNNNHITNNNNINSSSISSEKIAAKENEIKALLDEVKRLKDIQETHKDEILKLEENIDAKRQHINILESQLDDNKNVKSPENNRDNLNESTQTSTFHPIQHENSFTKQTANLQEVQTESILDHISKTDKKPLETFSAEKNPFTTHIPNFVENLVMKEKHQENENYQNFDRNHLQNIVPNIHFLSSLQYQFPERNHFRFADDLQLPPGTSLAGRLGDSLIPKGDPMEAKLQEMLRYNMDKYANQSLDTLHISRRVRELLSVHNIGQRLFAKYVLGLSQGTVSELLSKPKPWDKLTEKGRDSYRKMHAWACDDKVVLLLKSLIPKKDSNQPFGKSEDCQNEEKSLLKSNVSNNQLEYESNNDDDLESDNNMEDYSRDNFSKIYQEEFAKIMRTQSFLFPHFFNRNIPSNLSNESIRLNCDNYQKEVMKYKQNNLISSNQKIGEFLGQILPNDAQDLSMPKDINVNKDVKTSSQVDTSKQKLINETIKSEDCVDKSKSNVHYHPSEMRTSTPITPNASSGEPSSLGNSILAPSAIPSTEDLSSSASPLQRMASITNSLISQPPMLPSHNTQQRPSKAILPPITQQQFDLFSNLNTEDIVRRVKESLSQYSISQRLFGESVLGLSQGSVSDLLARPKPWHMLTQKGREPFIRMKMFLEDENAVHKLVASQYKIAPEKLMRTGNYSGNPQLNHVLNNKLNASNTMEKIMNEMQQIQASTLPLLTPHNNVLMTTPPIPANALNANFNPINSNFNPENKPRPLQTISPLHHQQQNNLNIHRHKSPTVYEMAALTQDLDTQIITTKIKEALLAHNIGQKIFGEVVLGLSQGSVSELLSKPKPWHMLSIKGREPFIRMQIWLTDPNNIERLQYIKNERREASKKRKSSGHYFPDNSSDTSSNDTADFYANSPGGISSSNVQPSKKQRVLFSEEQKEALRIAFALDPYPNVSTIEFLATELNLATRTITNWFHNHRMRLKQQIPHGSSSEPLPSREQSNIPFDQAQFKLLISRKSIEQNKLNLNLPYQQCYQNNSNLASLLNRSLLPSCNEQDLHNLNEAFKEQMKGLDLSFNYNIKKEEESDDDEVVNSDSDSVSDNNKSQSQKENSQSHRLSRRKPVAPQWVNPDWQDRTVSEEQQNLNDAAVESNEISSDSKGKHPEIKIKEELNNEISSNWLFS